MTFLDDVNVVVNLKLPRQFMQGHRSGYVVARFHGKFWKTNDVIFRHEVSAHPFYRLALQVVPASCFIFVKLSRPRKCPCLLKRSGCVYWGEVHSQWVIDKLLWPLEIHLVLGPERVVSLLGNVMTLGESHQPARPEVTSSIRAITSGESLGITSRAPRFSVNCATFEAPVMTVLTRGFLATQAIAS